MIADFEATYKPVTPAQKNMVDEMASCRWRLDRYMAVEIALVDDEMGRMRSLPNNSPNTGIRLFPVHPLSRRRLHALYLIRRYLATLNLAFYKAYRVLRELQDKDEPTSPSLTIPVPDAQPQPPQPAPIAPIQPSKPQPEAPNQEIRNEPKAQAQDQAQAQAQDQAQDQAQAQAQAQAQDGGTDRIAFCRLSSWWRGLHPATVPANRPPHPAQNPSSNF